MSKTRVIFLALAVGSAIGAGMMAKNLLGQRQEDKIVEVNTVQTVDVLVAAKDVLMGGKFAEGTLIWQAWPKDNVTPTMITKEAKPDSMQELTTARARLAVYAGETVIDKKILRPGQGGFMGALLTKGMRAISVAISARSSAGGFILPDDRVDVILTKKNISGGQGTVKSETVLSNVRVLAVNQIFRQAAEGDPVTVEKGETATLELTLLQSEVIAQVESSGELSLALRSIAESEGKSPQENQPVLAEKYNPNGAKRVANDTLFVRAGIESYATNQ
jgi:pilus assembly protein CpaB